MLEAKALLTVVAAVALVGTLVGSSGIAGPTRSEVLLGLGALVALRLASPRRAFVLARPARAVRRRG